MSDTPSNTPEFSVSELSNALKRTIEDRFGLVRIRGEVSNYRGPHSSGHAYFSLKDENARIDAVVWKGTFARLKTKPQEGLEVVATGKVTTFPGKSAYQIVIETLEPAGVGALMALIEERRRKLAAEGLFDADRKRSLPFLPGLIGVVTSPTGAVIRDILHRIAERFPRHILVWPVRVQGETSAAEVAAAVAGFNALPATGALPRPHLIIVARGGGSLEDLWGFNEEIVVRAVADSTIPVIAAIGHETDWTLIDHVADLRAPTPTAAAEKAVPVRAELVATLADLGRRHNGAQLRHVERRRAELRALARALPQGDALVGIPRQRLDRAAAAFAGSFARRLDQRRIALARLAHRLASQSPQARLARAGQRLEALEHRLQQGLTVARDRRLERTATLSARLVAAFSARMRVEGERATTLRHRLATFDRRLGRALTAIVAQRRQSLDAAAGLLQSLGYGQVLARGFALVRDAKGMPLRSAGAIAAGALLDLQFADGHVAAIAGTETTPAPAKRAPAKTRKKSEQSSLF
jgi:exodeoxyribonuclease VII large subunit